MTAASRAQRGLSRGLSFHTELSYEGPLRLKTSSLRGTLWRDVYAVLADPPVLFLFRTRSSDLNKPLLSVALSEVHRVERILSSSQPFAFALVPYISSGGVVKLAASSEDALSTWMKMLRKIRTFNDPPPPSSNDEAYDFDLRIPKTLNKCLDEDSLPRMNSFSDDVYEALEESTKDPPSHFVNDLIVFDDDGDFNRDNAVEVVNEEDAVMDLFINSAPASISFVKSDLLSDIFKFENIFTGNSDNIDNMSKIRDDEFSSEFYYNAAFFNGSKDEGNDLLRLKALNGVYLVRLDSVLNKHYLEVLDDFVVLSFEVLYELRGCRLSKDVFYFCNITFLLYHYSFTNLPESCTHLEIPFRLIESI